ncbi:type-F conjugative transfer system pilin chaperone TraQ, partial [Salmonella enterica]
MHKYKFSLPRLDITGMWVFSLGVWFHIVARLVYSKPWMAFLLAE